MAHVGAIRAFAEAAGDFDLGIAVFIEGEEEWASRSFANFLRENRDLLAADAIIVADSGNWDVETPAITSRSAAPSRSTSASTRWRTPRTRACTAVRCPTRCSPGSACSTPSGTRRARWPSRACARPGLETPAVRRGAAPRGGGTARRRRADRHGHHSVAHLVEAVDHDHRHRRTRCRERVEHAPARHPGSRERSNRPRPGRQGGLRGDPHHLEANAPFGARLAFEDIDTGQPFLVDTSGWAVAETRAAMAEAWGREPVEIGVGGSIPFIAELVEEFPGAQILVTGVEDPESKAHSPNESLHLGVFKRALLAEALFLARLEARGDAS
jgi:hypothetical protein